MDVAPHWIEGKVIKIVEKKVLSTDRFNTPPCCIRKIPTGTVYYELVVSGKEFIPNYEKREEINKEQTEKKLVFFEMSEREKNKGQLIKIEKSYKFFCVSVFKGYNWIETWKETD